MLPKLQLKIAVHGRHPWFYRKMIRRPEKPIPAGSAVSVVDRTGRPVGVGYYNPRTDLALRMLSRGKVRDPQAHLLETLDAAIRTRHDLLQLPQVTDGYRLCHSEGDGMPGLVLDRLGGAIVAQLFSLCMQKEIEGIGERLLEHFPGAKLVLTVDAQAREREGMDKVPPPPRVETIVTEHGLSYAVSAGRGHKTGFFADQRDSRKRVRDWSEGRKVLDLCCNSGGFAMNAARGGAREVLAADLDESVVEIARRNLRENDCQGRVEHGDAFDVLREQKPGRFDLIVCDPPKWAASKHEVDQAVARYRDLNTLALERLQPGGILATFSCSGAVAESKFLATVREAAQRARRDVRILFQGGAGEDHPVALECPETRYLKALFVEVRA